MGRILNFIYLSLAVIGFAVSMSWAEESVPAESANASSTPSSQDRTPLVSPGKSKFSNIKKMEDWISSYKKDKEKKQKEKVKKKKSKDQDKKDSFKKDYKKISEEKTFKKPLSRRKSNKSKEPKKKFGDTFSQKSSASSKDVKPNP